MKTYSQDQRNSYSEFTKQFSVALSSNAFIFRFIGIGIFVMLVPGILFACILFGLFYGFEKIALISNSAYQLFRMLLSLPDMPPHLVKPPFWYIVYNCVSLMFPSFLFMLAYMAFFLSGFVLKALHVVSLILFIVCCRAVVDCRESFLK